MSLFDVHHVEFPNLGLEFYLSRGFTVFGFHIYWYAVIIACGLMLAVLYGMKNAKGFGIDQDRMLDVALITIPFAFLGARLYYVLFSGRLDWYLDDPVRVLNVRDGGLGIYGGIIVAFVVGTLACRWRKVNVLAMFDVASLGFLIGQGIGRWGNFFNQEAFGGNTDLPWGMTGDIIRSGQNGAGYILTQPVHPTFLYESLWCLLGFVLLHILFKKAYKFNGMLFCGYAVWYGVGRFLIESLRTDSLMTGGLRTSQIVAVVAVAGGAALFGYLYWRYRRTAKEEIPHGADH
ncbi:MAG: prolipoprotein diacylglyceryl transferase [Clostridia bacterium]|nr:prolipoprotein diacylglyceryl transferase [Clostridia bacterium]